MMIRLQKVIAACGLASRRTAETMIRNGEVTVNGTVVRVLGTCVDPLTDHVKVNGHHVRQAEPEAFVLLHKPPGCVTTMSDPQGRPTIADILTGVKVRVFPVGRLDYDAEGLLLLTNNGKVAQACLHPRYHVPKTYLVKVSGVCTAEELRTLQNGVALEDGITAPAVVRKSGKARVNSWLELTIHEGRKHQVKRMIEAMGHRVVRIKRTRFGPLVLGDLRVGACRFATDAEANALRALLHRPAGAGTRRPDRAARASVSARPARPTLPARTRKPTPPLRRSADGGRRRPAVRPSGTSRAARGQRPRDRGQTR
ncbi:MAG: pseudouridine synthase [Nitrospira sp.]|nr:pseudouridine synthase [Nitrospira sp.]